MFSAEQLWRAVRTAMLSGFVTALAVSQTVGVIRWYLRWRRTHDFAGCPGILWLVISWFCAAGSVLAVLLAMSIPAK